MSCVHSVVTSYPNFLASSSNSFCSIMIAVIGVDPANGFQPIRTVACLFCALATPPSKSAVAATVAAITCRLFILIPSIILFIRI